MNDLRTRLEFARVVLRELSREPLSRTSLEKHVSKQSVSHACFEGIFRFLVADGDVVKCDSAHLAPYRLTEKGRSFLAWRSCGE